MVNPPQKSLLSPGCNADALNVSGTSSPCPPYVSARALPSALADATTQDNVYLLDRRLAALRNEHPLSPSPAGARSGAQLSLGAPTPRVTPSEYNFIAPGTWLMRHVPADLYDSLPYRSLTRAQVQRVPEFDLTLQERPLQELSRPVCCLSGSVAHVFAYDELMAHWRDRRTNPFTGAELYRGDIFRVANCDPKAPPTWADVARANLRPAHSG